MSFLNFILMCNAFIPLLVAIMFAISGMWVLATAFFSLSLVSDIAWFTYLTEKQS